MSFREELKKAVGPGKPNEEQDVRLVQRLLDRQSARTGIIVPQNGSFDRQTYSAITTFQRRINDSSAC